MSKYVERVRDDILDPQTLLPALEGGANYVHMDDVVAGHIAAAKHGSSGER